MDIQHTLHPTAPKHTAINKSDKTDHTDKLDQADKEEKSSEVGDASRALKFAQLLQGLQGEHSEASAEEAGQTLQAAPADLAEALVLPTDSVNVESLVGQTERLDRFDIDLALQDGSLLQQRKELGLQPSMPVQPHAAQWGAQVQVAVGQQVATVAAGVQQAAVQPSVMPSLGADMAAMPTGAALSVLAQATGAAEALAQQVADAVTPEALTEGRVVLQGAWKFEDQAMAMNPAMLRLAGQVEQWAAAAAGVQPKPNERVEAGKGTNNGTPWLSSDQGSGMRLTENAVQEAQQAQDAMFESPAEEPMQDMRFWLQGKQQRAEVLMTKDGQPVRVQVTLRGNEAHVTFQSDQLQTRELLDGSLAQLREMLQEQGLELAGVSVRTESGDGGSGQQQTAAQRNPWEAAPTQHAQVALPQDAPLQSPRPPASGLSLYA